jgi:hypothetical protein
MFGNHPHLLVNTDFGLLKQDISHPAVEPETRSESYESMDDMGDILMDFGQCSSTSPQQ